MSDISRGSLSESPATMGRRKRISYDEMWQRLDESEARIRKDFPDADRTVWDEIHAVERRVLLGLHIGQPPLERDGDAAILFLLSELAKRPALTINRTAPLAATTTGQSR